MQKLPDGTAWDRYGTRGAPMVVLIHGFGLNHAMWQWMIPALADSYDIVALDLYGHGDSAPPPEKNVVNPDYGQEYEAVFASRNRAISSKTTFPLHTTLTLLLPFSNPVALSGVLPAQAPSKRTAHPFGQFLSSKIAGPLATLGALHLDAALIIS